MKSITSWTFGVFISLTLCFKDTHCQSGAPVRLFVDQRATLCEKAVSCENARFTRTFPSVSTIAMCQKHKCAIEEGFLEKFEFEDNDLVLKSAKYTDWGTYECACNGISTFVKWDVVVALNVSAQELDNITLVCFAKDAKDVTWFHNGRKILQSWINGSTYIAEVFRNSASLEEGAFKDGTLSLTLCDVRRKDAGLYECFFNGETAKGYPNALMLHLNDNPSSPVEHKADFTEEMICAFIIFLLALTIVVLLVKLNKANRQSTSKTSRSAESVCNPSENVHMLPVSVDESQSAQTVAQPVQESENYPKSSSTQPF